MADNGELAQYIVRRQEDDRREMEAKISSIKEIKNLPIKDKDSFVREWREQL
jgi:hypothetical protein